MAVRDLARNKPKPPKASRKRPLPVALLCSLGLHLSLVLLAVFGLPRFRDPQPPLSSMQVSLISAAELAAAEARPAAPQPTPEPTPQPEPPETALAVPQPAAPDPGPAPQVEATPPPPVDRVAPQAVPAQDLPDGATFVPPQAEVPVQQPDPTPEQPPSAPEEASPQTITEAVETEETPAPVPQTAPRPAPRPVRAPEVDVAQDTPPEPEPQPTPQPDPEPEPTPEPTPEPDPVSDPIADAVAAALADSQITQPTTAGPTGPPLTGTERDALRLAVGQCWNLGSTSTEAMRVTVTVAMDMTADGLPVASSIRMIDYTDGNEAAAEIAYDAARRAILRCQGSGYPLPAEKYGQWQQIEMTFNPERMRLR